MFITNSNVLIMNYESIMNHETNMIQTWFMIHSTLSHKSSSSLTTDSFMKQNHHHSWFMNNISWVISYHSSFCYDLSSIMIHLSFLNDDSLLNDEWWWWMLISESRIMIHSLYMILEWWLMNDDDGSSTWVSIPS